MRAWIAVVVVVVLVALALAQDEVSTRSPRGGRRGSHRFGDRAINGTRLRNRQDRLGQRLRRRWEKLTDEEKAALKERAELWRQRRIEKINPDGDTLEEVNAQTQVDQDLVQGDMVLTDEQLDSVLPDDDDDSDDEETRAKRQAYRTSRYPSNLWGTTPIPYTLDSTLSTAARTVIAKAIAFWQNKTCIRFVQSSTGTNSIRFFKGSGCYSYVGKIGGVQDVSIGQGCETVGIAAHEIAHALGFLHAQSRVDRDTYVTVNFNNIQSGKESNFAKETNSTNYNYGLTYDLGSVMQYSAFSFAKDTSIPTVVAKETGYQNTMGHLLPTFYDVYMMNQHYQCFSKCSSQPTCQNGGVVDVNSCTKCVCPQGYGGNLCQTRASGCGANITVDATRRNYSIPLVGNGQTTVVDDYTECNYIFTAPAGKKVKFTIRQIGYVCSSGCTYSGVEIRVKSDKRNSGYRYCCAADVGTTVTSQSNVVPVHIFNRYYYAGATLEYSAV